MTKGEIKNAVITSTMLGYEGHGILTLYLTLDYGGAGQSFGGYSFDYYDKAVSRRVPAAYGMRFIAEVMRVVGVEKYEALVGKPIRVDASHDRVHRIGNLLRDDWFDPDEMEVAE